MIENASFCVYTLTTSQNQQLRKYQGISKNDLMRMHKVVAVIPL
ncbi:hypothetical protein C1A50_1124 [Paenibacillus polymyxa]|nr:hypothetical protein C1A50_1124 [Paenibacillus polymyxa]